MESIGHIVADKYLKQQELPSHKQIPAQNYIDWAQVGAEDAQRWFPVSEKVRSWNKVVDLIKDYTPSFSESLSYYMRAGQSHSITDK